MIRHYIRAATAVAIPALGLLLAVLYAGCSARKPTPEPPPPPPIDQRLIDLAPAGAQLVVWVDVAQLRGSPLWDIVELLFDAEEYIEIKSATGFDPLEVVDEVLVTISQRPEGEDGFVAIVKGRFDALGAMRSLSEASKGQLIERYGFSGVTGKKMLLFAVTERTVVVATESAIDAALKLATRQGRSLSDDPRFADFPVDTDAAGLLRYRRGAMAPDLSRLRPRPPMTHVDKVSKLDASAILTTGLAIAWQFDVDDKITAAATARELRGLVDDLSSNTFVMLIGLDWIFDRITVAAQGTAVNVDIVLDEADIEQLRRLALRLKKIRQLAQPGQGSLELDPPQKKVPRIPGPLRVLPKPKPIKPQLKQPEQAK